MMRSIPFSVAFFVTLSLVLISERHNPLGSSLPRLGAFLSPFEGFWQNAEATKTTAGGTLRIPGLGEPVRVVMDERLVPHIFAKNVEDAVFVQGYLTARHRLWQMDFADRAISGRLSEVLGEQALEYDRLQRRLGFVQYAKRELINWQSSDLDRGLINAYTQGVNAYIEQLTPADYPLEFKLLGYAPEAWTPLKSALKMQSMAKSLCFRADDLGASNLRNALGEEMYRFLFPEWNPQQSPIIPAGTPWDFEPVDTNRLPQPSILIGRSTPFRSVPQPDPFLGSNNWAVSGKKTASGYPILCNDPHLQLMLPSIWYEVQLHTPGGNAYGASLPGLPGIVIGFNEDIAWGMTNVGHDVLDWYEIAWTDTTRQSYLYDNEVKAVSKVEERIGVRGRAEPFRDTVKYTVWGPVVYEEGGADHQGMSMYWIPGQVTGERPFYEVGCFYHLITAKNYEDYQQALANYAYPAQNFVFAAKDGDIALTVGGILPLKRQQQGKFIQSGAFSRNAWAGFVPWAHNPRVRNPGRGFVSSANQHTTAPDYPYYYFASFDDYRGRLINRELARFEDASITANDMKALQTSNYSLLAEEALSAMIALLQPDRMSNTAAERLQFLREWDFRFEANQRAPVYFELWRREAYRRTFDEVFQLADSQEVQYPESWRFVDLLINQPQHPIFDRQTTKEVEDASDIVSEAFTTLDSLSPDVNWSEHKSTDILHLIRQPAFSAMDLEVGGSGDAPNAITPTHGPSWRMVVELGQEIRAWGVYPGGQSGNPGSRFYDFSISAWRQGDYHQLFFMQDADDRRQPVLFTMEFEKGK
jgi:penicillin amidase